MTATSYMRRAEVRATALVAAEGEATQPDRAHLHFKLGWWALLRELRVVSYLEATRTEISVLHAVCTRHCTFFLHRLGGMGGASKDSTSDGSMIDPQYKMGLTGDNIPVVYACIAAAYAYWLYAGSSAEARIALRMLHGMIVMPPTMPFDRSHVCARQACMRWLYSWDNEIASATGYHQIAFALATFSVAQTVWHGCDPF